jgi:hypothetical protein
LSVNLLKNNIGIEQAQSLAVILKKHPTLKSLFGNKGNETELDMSGKMRGAADVIMLVAEIVDNRALTSLNLASNHIGVPVLPEGWAKNVEDYEGKHQYVFTNTDGTKQTLHPGKPEGIIAVADAINDMGALTLLNMSKNRIKGAEAGKALGDAFAGNTVLKELDLSGEPYNPNMDIGFVKAFTPGLSDNGALAKLDISNNNIGQGELTELCNSKGIELDNHESESESDD